MLYIIENISNEDIIINDGILKPNKKITINNAESFIDLIRSKKLKIKSYENDSNKLFIEKQNEKDMTLETHTNFISNHIKQQIMDSFFKLYFNEELNNSELDMLKWFYKDIGFTKNISNSTLSLLENATNKEELVEVLLNNVYPELLDKHFDGHQLKNK